jgi:pilus assembly protein Flp/PilA
MRVTEDASNGRYGPLQIAPHGHFALDARPQEKHGVLKMGAFITHFIDEEAATTAIEYGLIAAGIAVAIIGAVNSLGSAVLVNLFTRIDAAMP